MSRRAIAETLRTCIEFLGPNDPLAIERFASECVNPDIPSFVNSPNGDVAEGRWIEASFRRMTETLCENLIECSNVNRALAKAFRDHFRKLVDQWAVRWGYAGTTLEPSSASGELIKHSLRFHAREVVHQLKEEILADARGGNREGPGRPAAGASGHDAAQRGGPSGVPLVFPEGGPMLIPAQGGQPDAALHFNILPNTGIQIRRGLHVPANLGVKPEALWEAARREAKLCEHWKTVALIGDHIACNRKTPEESSGWIACDPTELVFFRLTRPGKGMQMLVDMVIDTPHGAGHQPTNQIDCLIRVARVWPLSRAIHVASFYVLPQAQAADGDLIMDYGNSSCSFIFSRIGSGGMKSSVMALQNPFDPLYRKRTPEQRALFKSSVIVLHVEENRKLAPWLVMGERAEDLVRDYPHATYLYAPKKYVRRWPEHLKDRGIAMTLYRGVSPSLRRDLHPRLEIVRESIGHLLQLVLSSLTNPGCDADQPSYAPRYPACPAHLPADLEGVGQGPVLRPGGGRGAQAGQPPDVPSGIVPREDDLQ